MNLTEIWHLIFHTDTLLGLNIGFWVSMTAVALIVVIMNAVFWSLKPGKKHTGSDDKKTI